jgi:fibronectin type 3 domain-containing protein
MKKNGFAFGLLAIMLLFGLGLTGCDNGTIGGGGGGDITTVPSVPTGVTAATQSSSSIMVSWGAVAEATSYAVYYEIGNSSTKNLAGTVTGTSYTHTGLTANTTYFYYIKAVNSAGESTLSSYAYATTSSSGSGGTTSKPGTPTGVTAAAQSSSSIKVSWGAVAGATSYAVYYEIGSSSTKNLAGTVTGTSYTHTGLTASTTYYYYIKAVNSAGESNYSSYGSATTSSSGSGGTTSKPAAPTGVTATAQSSTTIRITWNAVSGATSYKVYIGQASYSTFTELIGTSTTTSYNDTACYPGETWYYKVSAVNSAGESALSSYASATTPSSGGGGTVTIPNPPYGIMIRSASTTSSSLTVEWDASANATSYKLYRSTSSSGSFSVVYSGSATTYTNTGLSSGTTYYYKVTAVNSAGESGYNSTGPVSGTTK